MGKVVKPEPSTLAAEMGCVPFAVVSPWLSWRVSFGDSFPPALAWPKLSGLEVWFLESLSRC